MTKGIRRKSWRVPPRNFVYYHMFLYMASKSLSTCVSRLSMDEQLTIINSVLTSRIRIYSDCYNYVMVRQTLGYAYMILENCIFKWWPSWFLACYTHFMDKLIILLNSACWVTHKYWVWCINDIMTQDIQSAWRILLFHV